MTNRLRRSLLLIALLGTGAVHAQTYPTGPVKLIVPFPPGGSVDMVARAVAKRLADSLGKPVVVDNRAGASRQHRRRDRRQVAGRRPYAVRLQFRRAGGQHPPLQAAGFDPFKDFTPVIRLVNQPNILMVHPTMPVKSVQDLVAWAKSKPGNVTMGSAGVGTGQDIAAKQFEMATGAAFLHVPYKGGAPALNDLMGGQINAMFETSPTALPYVKSEKLRALAITTAKRSPLLPDLPTVAEAGVPGYESVTWIGLVAPAGTPKAIVDRLNADLNKGLAAEMGKQFAEISLDPIGGTPEAMADTIKDDAAMYGKIIKAAGIEPQ